MKRNRKKEPGHHSIWMDVMFKAVKLPASIANLNTCLTNVNAYYFSHFPLSLSLTPQISPLTQTLSLYRFKVVRSKKWKPNQTNTKLKVMQDFLWVWSLVSLLHSFCFLFFISWFVFITDWKAKDLNFV